MGFSGEEYTEAYVWIWLQGETEPVVAGKLTAEGRTLVFNYGQSYLKRDNALSIYDAAPDAWGRRVIINKFLNSFCFEGLD